MKIQTPKTATEIRLRRQELLNELREGLPRLGKISDKKLLEFCNITKETMAADCTWAAVPWSVMSMHYYWLATWASRARLNGRLPDGSIWGSDNPKATTPPYREIIEKEEAEGAAKRRRRA